MPKGDPIRFLSRQLESQTFVSWHGLGRTEWDYTVEPGTCNYMVELPISVAKDRGWILPTPSHLQVSTRSAQEFAALMELETALASRGTIVKTTVRVERLLTALDALTSNALYNPITAARVRGSVRSQGRIVKAATEYLKEHGSETDASGAKLSATVGCSRRSLYAAFQAQVGLGPRKVDEMLRLYKLRSLLREGAPGHTTVSKLMHEAGFSHLGRTAGLYRSHFGETPSKTLRGSA